MSEDKQGIRLHGPVELASSKTKCWKCREQTPVHALLAANLEEYEPEQEEEMRVGALTFFYDIDPEALPVPVQAAVATVAPNYKPMYSHTMGETTWENACVHCDALQGAFYM